MRKNGPVTLPFAVAPAPFGSVNGTQRIDRLDRRRRRRDRRGHGHRCTAAAPGLAAQLSVGRGHQLVLLMVLHVMVILVMVFDQRLMMVWGQGGAAWPRPRDVLRFGGRLKQPAVLAPRARCRRRRPASAVRPYPGAVTVQRPAYKLKTNVVNTGVRRDLCGRMDRANVKSESKAYFFLRGGGKNLSLASHNRKM